MYYCLYVLSHASSCSILSTIFPNNNLGLKFVVEISNKNLSRISARNLTKKCCFEIVLDRIIVLCGSPDIVLNSI